MVAQEGAPLRLIGDGGELAHDLDDGRGVLHRQRHVQPRHDREIERHVEFWPLGVAEIGQHVLRPLVRLGQQNAPRKVCIDMAAQFFEEGVRLRQIFAVRTLAFV